MKLDTMAVHAWHKDGKRTSSVTPDIVLSTTFERNTDGTYPDGFVYTRGGNPNRDALESALAQLEGATHAFAFASGLASVNALLQTLNTGDHVIIPDDVYHGTRNLVTETFAGWGLAAAAVDMTDTANVTAALRDNTRLIWLETPSNPALKIADIRAIADIAHEAGALCAIDNTWATCVNQRPLELGADVVMYSTTKYFGGHSDVLSGALIIGDEHADTLGTKLRHTQKHTGGVPAPFDCWLLLRSLPTFPLRVRQQTANAGKIAAFLAEQQTVHTVNYPGLATHPNHEIAAQQMSGFGGMLSFCVNGGGEAAVNVANRVQLITQATSLGGVESLIEHRASVEGPNSPTAADLLRLSVGIEDVDDLMADLAQALGG